MSKFLYGWCSRCYIVSDVLSDRCLCPSCERKQPEPATTPLDQQVGGDHYKENGIQPVEYIHVNGLGFIEGNVVKYVTRHRRKGGKQDLEKAIHFLRILIDLEYGDTDV